MRWGLFIPQGGKGTFLYGVQLSFSFNLLYMNIYTPEIRSFIWRRWRWRRWRRWRWRRWRRWRWSRFFLSLFFLKLIYIIAHVYTYFGIRGKCAQQLSYEFNMLNKLGTWQMKIKITIFRGFFKKWVQKSRFLEK